MIDTHTHLYLPEFEEDRKEVVENALKAGVEHFVLPNVDIDTIGQMIDLQKEYPKNVSIALGLHPTSVAENYKKDLELIQGLFDHYKCVAIGEVGIDLYWDKSRLNEQMEAFSEQINWAYERKLPVIIHCREALNEVIEVIGQHKEKLPKLIFHSFTGSSADVKRIREVADAYFGINGVVTFKNALELRGALPEIGIDRMLLETDSPYLTPAPFRGKRNDSSRLFLIRDKIAEVLCISIDEVDKTTTKTAKEIFQIP